MWGSWAGLRRYAVVKVLARLSGRVVMELIYHEMSGMSSGAGADCRAGMVGIVAGARGMPQWRAMVTA